MVEKLSSSPLIAIDSVIENILITALNPLPWDALLKECTGCSTKIGLKSFVSKVYGEISFYPSECETCKETAYTIHLQDDHIKAWKTRVHRCFGLQNKKQRHQDMVPMLESVTRDHAWQEKFIAHIVGLCSGELKIGAYLTGNPGGGKTFLAKILHNELLGQYEDSCFVKSVDLAIMLRRLSFKDDYQSILNQFRNVKFLIVDDYGVQKNTDFVKEAIFSIFDYRYENQKTTIITTNLEAQDVEESEHRLFSRIQDPKWMKKFDFSAYDLRQAAIYN